MNTNITKNKNPHVGPGRVIVSIYADQKLHARIKRRAKTLGLSTSAYVLMLAKNEIENPFVFGRAA